MNIEKLIDLIKSNSEERVSQFIFENIDNRDILNLDSFQELKIICFNSSNFFIKNLIDKLPIYINLTDFAKEGDIVNLQKTIDEYTIDCHIANKAGEIAAKNNKFKVLEFLFDEGIDLDYNDNIFLEMAANFQKSNIITYILNDYEQKSKRPKFNAPMYFFDDNELMTLDFNEAEEGSQMEIFEPSLMQVLFEKQNLFENLIKNNMIHDFHKIHDLKQQYSPFLEDTIDNSKLLILSAKENVFQMFNYMIQNGFDPYFEKNPIFKNDNQLIIDIAKAFNRSDGNPSVLIKESLDKPRVFNYLLKNREFYKIQDNTIYECLEEAANNKDSFLCEKITQEGFTNYTGNSINTKRFLNEIKGNIKKSKEEMVNRKDTNSTKVII